MCTAENVEMFSFLLSPTAKEMIEQIGLECINLNPCQHVCLGLFFEIISSQ